MAQLLAFGAAFYGLFLVFAIGQTPSRYLATNAWLGHTILGWLGQQTHVAGCSIVSARFAVTVTPECAAGEYMALFCAGVLVFPALWSRKMIGLVVGVAFVVLLNVGRIVQVFLVGTFQPDFFTALHEEVWPGLFVLATLGLVFGWARWTMRDREGEMKLTPAFKSLTTGFMRLALALAVLLMPWPGLPKACDASLRGVGGAMFSDPTGPREVTFEALDAHHTRIVIVNRARMAPDGSGPVRNVDLNAFSFLWRPLVLLVGLAWLTPPEHRQRFSFLGWGTVWLLGYFYMALAFAIWNESTEVGLVMLSPFWKEVANGLEMALAQLGILMPIFAWLWFAMVGSGVGKAKAGGGARVRAF